MPDILVWWPEIVSAGVIAAGFGGVRMQINDDRAQRLEDLKIRDEHFATKKDVADVAGDIRVIASEVNTIGRTVDRMDKKMDDMLLNQAKK